MPFPCEREAIRRIFHRFQNVPASCERSLIAMQPQELKGRTEALDSDSLDLDFCENLDSQNP